MEINSTFAECLMLLLSQEYGDLKQWGHRLLGFFEAELDLAESSFYLKHRRKNTYELLYTQASQAAAEYIPESHAEEVFYIDAIFPEKNTAPEKTKTLLLPLYYEKAQLKAFLLFELSTALHHHQLGLLHSLHAFLNHSFQKVFKEYQQQLEIEKLLAINDAMEASQQAMHENAEQMLRLHKQLTDSLQYAQRMQKAILPSEERMKGIFEDFFVIYQPKDIVSGDFFWCSRLDYTFVAVVDCTGHGVPGAFMSMIGHTLLNEIINIKRESDPATILRLLNKGVEEALSQKETKNMDGMDIGLCRLHRDEDFRLHLCFAGAKNNIFVYHQKQLQFLKGDRLSIGGQIHREALDFQNQHLLLDDGDIIYMCTDGYADTANAQREKIGTQKYQELLLSQAEASFEEQKQALLDFLHQHQQGTAQRDDITVLGIRV